MEICTVSHLSEVTRMVLVKVDPVMVLATSVSATSRVLPVLSDPGQNVRERASQKPRPSNEQLPAVSVGHMTSQLPGLLLASGHRPLVSLLKRDRALHQIHQAGSVIEQSLKAIRLENWTIRFYGWNFKTSPASGSRCPWRTRGSTAGTGSGGIS